jgi:hypothetical protein
MRVWVIHTKLTEQACTPATAGSSSFIQMTTPTAQLLTRLSSRSLGHTLTVAGEAGLGRTILQGRSMCTVLLSLSRNRARTHSRKAACPRPDQRSEQRKDVRVVHRGGSGLTCVAAESWVLAESSELNISKPRVHSDEPGDDADPEGLRRRTSLAGFPAPGLTWKTIILP